MRIWHSFIRIHIYPLLQISFPIIYLVENIVGIQRVTAICVINHCKWDLNIRNVVGEGKKTEEEKDAQKCIRIMHISSSMERRESFRKRHAKCERKKKQNSHFQVEDFLDFFLLMCVCVCVCMCTSDFYFVSFLSIIELFVTEMRCWK